MPDACEETCGDIYYELTEDRLWILISAADDSFGTGGHEILACLQLYKNGIRPAQNKVKMHVCCPDFCYPPFLLLVRMSLFLKHILMFASGSRLSFFTEHYKLTHKIRNLTHSVRTLQYQAFAISAINLRVKVQSIPYSCPVSEWLHCDSSTAIRTPCVLSRAHSAEIKKSHAESFP